MDRSRSGTAAFIAQFKLECQGESDMTGLLTEKMQVILSEMQGGGSIGIETSVVGPNSLYIRSGLRLRGCKSSHELHKQKDTNTAAAGSPPFTKPRLRLEPAGSGLRCKRRAHPWIADIECTIALAAQS